MDSRVRDAPYIRRDHGFSTSHVLAHLQRRVVKAPQYGAGKNGNVHRGDVLRHLPMRYRAREHHILQPSTFDIVLDFWSKYSVADQEEAQIRQPICQPICSVDQQIEPVKGAKAAHPTDHKAVLHPESLPNARSVKFSGEQLQIHGTGRYDDLASINPHRFHFLSDL